VFSGNPKAAAAASKSKRGEITASAVTILTSGCHFNGKLYCRGSTRIGGKIEGEIISEGLLIIEEEALISADIKADEVVIQGRIQGRLEARGRVELCSTCSFEGDILTPILVITEGAQFNGRSSMNIEQIPPGAGLKDQYVAPSVSDGLSLSSEKKGPEVSVVS